MTEEEKRKEKKKASSVYKYLPAILEAVASVELPGFISPWALTVDNEDGVGEGDAELGLMGVEENVANAALVMAASVEAAVETWAAAAAVAAAVAAAALATAAFRLQSCICC